MSNTTAHEPLLLNAREAAKALRVSERTLFALRQTGGLPYVRLGPRAIRYPREALLAWARRRTEGGAA